MLSSVAAVGTVAFRPQGLRLVLGRAAVKPLRLRYSTVSASLSSSTSSSGRNSGSMAAPQAKYGYTIIYTENVEASLEFYNQAFGMKTKFMDPKRMWGELDSGETTIAFTPFEQREATLAGGIQHQDVQQRPPNVELNLVSEDVEGLYQRAVNAGAIAVAPLEDKKWGQRCGYVRDLNGVSIRIGSVMHGEPQNNVASS
eukprot:jgi/Chlat1/6439/Chrsp45S05953